MQHTLTPTQAVTLQLYSKAVSEKAKELQALNAAMYEMLSGAYGEKINVTDKISFDQNTRVLTIEPAPQKAI